MLLSGRPNIYMCRLPFQAQISGTQEHVDLSLYKPYSFIAGQSVTAAFPCESAKGESANGIKDCLPNLLWH
jgi:hypothetical protein